MRDRAGKKTMEWARRLQGGFCLFFIVLGMSICMESLFALSIPWEMRLSVIFVVMVLAELSSFGIWWMLSAILVFAGVFAVICVRCQQMLRAGMAQFLNHVLEMINEYYRTDYLLIYLEESEEYVFLVLLSIVAVIGFLEGLLLLAGRGRKCGFLIAAILPSLVVASGLMVGLAPLSLGILLMFIGLAAWIFDFRERGRALACGILLASILLPALLVSEGRVWERVDSLNGEWQVRQLAWEDQMLAAAAKISDFPLFSQKELKQYSLRNEKPDTSGKEVLQITVDKRPLSSVYLRGFVGGDYENGTWKRISRQEFSDWAQAMGGDEQTYARIIQNYPYDFSAWAAKDTFTTVGFEKQVSVKLNQPMERYTLTPYFSKLPEKQPLKADGIFPAGKSTQFAWNSFLNMGEYALTASQYQYPGAWDSFLWEEDLARNMEIWNYYSDYVKEAYRRLPEEGLEELRAYAKDLKTYEGTFKEIQKKLSGKNTWEFEEMMAILTEEEISIMNGNADELGYNIRQIMQLLWKDNRYSFDLEQTPKGEDIVKDFLLRQHKGYCTHFASAATLLLRMKGIPARYASGYLVLTSDFKENADGTWTAAVTDERAHAWTEVFYNNLGFCPIEATPPEYKEMLDGMDEGQTVANAVQQMDREYEQQHPEADRKDEEQIQEPQKEPDDGNTASEAGKPQPGMKNKRGNGDRTGIAEFLSQSRRILISAGLAVFAAAGLYLFLYLRRRWVLNGRKKRFEQNDRAQAVCEMGKELGRILELLGIKRMRGMDDREYLRVLEDELQEIDWEQFFLIFRKAKYSGQEIDKKEYGRAVYLYRNMEQRLVGKGKVRDWYIRYVKIYS